MTLASSFSSPSHRLVSLCLTFNSANNYPNTTPNTTPSLADPPVIYKGVTASPPAIRENCDDLGGGLGYDSFKAVFPKVSLKLPDRPTVRTVLRPSDRQTSRPAHQQTGTPLDTPTTTTTSPTPPSRRRSTRPTLASRWWLPRAIPTRQRKSLCQSTKTRRYYIYFTRCHSYKFDVGVVVASCVVKACVMDEPKDTWHVCHRHLTLGHTDHHLLAPPKTNSRKSRRVRRSNS